MPSPVDGADRLAPCPGKPNCVSSEADEAARRHVAPLPLDGGSAEEAMARLRRIIEALLRTRIVEDRADYLHAECRSRVFRFVDDLELRADRKSGVVHVRSAARVGRYDFGVNRRRVEEIRRRFVEGG